MARLNTAKGKRKPLTATAGAHILAEIRKMEARGMVVHKSGRFFVKCPFHNENTPSLMLTSSLNSSYEIGSFKCWGCGESGGWNKLATALGMAPVGEDNAVAKTVQAYEPEFYDSGLIEKYKSYDTVLEDLQLRSPKPMEKGSVWRTLPEKFLTSVGACMVTSSRDRKPYLFLPSYMNGEVVGGIKAVLKDTGEKGLIKYLNSNGLWSKSKGLYPYDFANSAMDAFEKEHGFRGLALVEGARDSLVMNCEGIPTVGLLGTQSWGQGKLDNVWDLNPDFILVVMDGDKSGREAEEKIFQDVKKLMPCRKANLTRFNRECGFEVDPGNAPPHVMDAIWQTLLKRKAQT